MNYLVFDVVGIAVFVLVLAYNMKLAYDRRHGFTTLQRAKSIMGRDIFTPDDFPWCLGLRLTHAERASLKRVPWSDTTLRACADGNWVLIPVPQFSLNRLREMDILNRFPRDHWYRNRKFACEVGMEFRWRLMRKHVLPRHPRLSLVEQLRTLRSNEVLPTARIAIFAMQALNRKQGDIMYAHNYVVCADVDSGCNVMVRLDNSYRLEFGLLNVKCAPHSVFAAPELLPEWREE